MVWAELFAAAAAVEASDEAQMICTHPPTRACAHDAPQGHIRAHVSHDAAEALAQQRQPQRRAPSPALLPRHPLAAGNGRARAERRGAETITYAHTRARHARLPPRKGRPRAATPPPAHLRREGLEAGEHRERTLC